MENLEATAFDDSMFDDDKDSLITKESKGETNPDLYRISLTLETVKNKTYSARGRLVRDPRWKDANGKYMGKYHKKQYYLTDPENTDRKFYVDCPSNWGVPISQNFVSSAFFKLREQDSATLKRIANQNFGQILMWWSLFKIDMDDQQPSLQNTIKIFRFGKPVNEIIEAQVKGKPELKKEGISPYHFFTGKDFFIQVYEKTVDDKDKGGSATKSFPSYDKSSFDDEITSILIDGERVKDTPAGRQKISEFIIKNSPELQQVEYKKWDEATEQKVIDSMRITIGDDDILNQIINDCRKGVRRGRVVVSKETQEKLDKNASESASASSTNTKAGGAAWEPKADSQPKNESKPATTEEASFSNAESLPDIETEELPALD